MSEFDSYSIKFEVTDDQTHVTLERHIVTSKEIAQRVIEGVAEALELESFLSIDDINTLPPP